MKEDKLQRLYDTYLEFTDHMVGEYGHNAVAGVMIAQALTIYKSSMDEADFNRMVDMISSNRSKIKTFENPVLQ